MLDLLLCYYIDIQKQLISDNTVKLCTGTVIFSDTGDLLSGGRIKGKTTLKKHSSSRSSKAKSKSSKAAESQGENESELASIGGRDTSLFLFRALGKILYCKSK